MPKHEDHWCSKAMAHCCESITNYKHIWGDKKSSTYMHQAQGKCTVNVFKLKTKCVPTTATIQGSFMAHMQCSKNNFDINITTQPTTCRTLLQTNIVQLLEENARAIVVISFASMQQHCRPVNWVIVPVSNILSVKIMCLWQTSDMESFNDLDLDYHSQHMWQIKDIIHKPFFGFIWEEFQYDPSLIHLDWHGRTRLQPRTFLMMVDVGYGRKWLQQYHGVYNGFEHQLVQTFMNLPIGKTNHDEFKFVA